MVLLAGLVTNRRVVEGPERYTMPVPVLGFRGTGIPAGRGEIENWPGSEILGLALKVLCP